MHVHPPSSVLVSALNYTSLISEASWPVIGVLAVLTLASIVSIGIILKKVWAFRRFGGKGRKFLEAFERTQDLQVFYSFAESAAENPFRTIFLRGYREYLKLTQGGHAFTDPAVEQSVRQALSRGIREIRDQAESRLTVLATISSSAPFIGLFGTVWGIMHSFYKIGMTGASSLAVVAPGISEALIATAIGLFAAIPAGIFYNSFVRTIQKQLRAWTEFQEDVLLRLRREW